MSLNDGCSCMMIQTYRGILTNHRKICQRMIRRMIFGKLIRIMYTALPMKQVLHEGFLLSSALFDAYSTIFLALRIACRYTFLNSSLILGFLIK